MMNKCTIYILGNNTYLRFRSLFGGSIQLSLTIFLKSNLFSSFINKKEGSKPTVGNQSPQCANRTPHISKNQNKTCFTFSSSKSYNSAAAQQQNRTNN